MKFYKIDIYQYDLVTERSKKIENVFLYYLLYNYHLIYIFANQNRPMGDEES